MEGMGGRGTRNERVKHIRFFATICLRVCTHTMYTYKCRLLHISSLYVSI